jgi:glycosyltransferase involved in cell wall biosynthesis
VIEKMQAHAASYEIIFIDNGSMDTTRAIMRELCVENPCVRAIFNTRNFGQMRSPTYAIYQAEGQAVIAMCADFQDPPELIGDLIDRWRGGAPIVLGVRRSENAGFHTSLAREWGYRFLSRHADFPVIPNATGFGLFDRRVVDALADWHEPEPFFRGMLVEGGFSIALIPYDRPERAGGQTKNGVNELLDFATSSLAGSSKGLLRKPILWSVFAGMGSIALLIVAALLAMLGASAWPWLLIGVQVGLFSILFLFLGLLGEQVRIVSERTRHVPLVLEQERVNFPADRRDPAARTRVRAPVGGQ